MGAAPASRELCCSPDGGRLASWGPGCIGPQGCTAHEDRHPHGGERGDPGLGGRRADSSEEQSRPRAGLVRSALGACAYLRAGGDRGPQRGVSGCGDSGSQAQTQEAQPPACGELRRRVTAVVSGTRVDAGALAGMKPGWRVLGSRLSVLSLPQVPSWSPTCSSWSSPACRCSTWSWPSGSSTERGLQASGRSAPS